MENPRGTVKPGPGTYALILSCSVDAVIQIGRLGQLQLRPGFYVYLGSALGPGGVRGRLAHHEKVSERPRWHIDYLRAHTKIDQVWYSQGTRCREHQWACAMRTVRGASMPMAGFGVSDCQCESHLYFFKRRPSLRDFERGLRALDPEHPRVDSEK